MSTVAIVQARMGSTRLPGKVLAEIEGRTMLERVCRRVAAAERIDRVLVATSEAAADEQVVDECRRLRVDCFRGSENDVLDRYYRAAEAAAAATIVRVTADCPLIDPAMIDQVVAAFHSRRPDYAANTLTRTFPRGLDTEVVGFSALRLAWVEAMESYERVHVTPYFYLNPRRFRLLSVSGPVDHSRHRWTVDTAGDLELVRQIYRRLGDDHFGWREVLALIEGHPELAALNEHVEHKQLVEG